MRCSKCGFDNPEGMRFCGQCSAPFVLLCPNCHFENPPAFKFCGQCTTSLAPVSAKAPPANSPGTVREPGSAVAIDGERKNVTALFADIKGSMELLEDLDPELARNIIDPALRLMMEAMRRYGGHVVQSTGDGIFATFGAPLAYEDHPQRALYAALKMQGELSSYSGRLLAQGRKPVHARVGINTGEVVVRSLKTDAAHTEYTPIGHPTGLAARMQALAPVGSVAVTGQTRKLCEGYFTFKSLGAARISGVSELVDVHEVTGLGPLRTHFQLSAERGLSKFVGRQSEIEQLGRALERTKAGRGQVVATLGEAGAGKSRLFYEFKAVAQSECTVLETFSLSYGKSSAYLPVIDLLRNYFGIAIEDDKRRRREERLGKLLALDSARVVSFGRRRARETATAKLLALDRGLEDTLPYLFALLGIQDSSEPLTQMDPQIRRRRTLDAIKRIFLRESLQQPLVLIFEDLHWADSETQALLDLLADSIANSRVLLLINYRPEYRHEWTNKSYYMQLRLDPLGKEDADEMLAALLGDGVELAPLKRLIIQRTEGNPFFIEEMVEMLFEEGVLTRNGAVRLVKRLSQVRVPGTVQGVLASRIDRLTSPDKDLLQTLSVIGKKFPLSLIRRVASRSDNDLDQMLADLQLAEFIYEQPALPDVEYTFKHALTQEVAYNSILVERRKLIHGRAAEAIENLFASSLVDHYAELAQHYSHSSNTWKAIEYLHLAGQQTLQRSANTEAITYFNSALALLLTCPDTPARAAHELTLQVALGPSLQASRGWAAPEVEHAYSRALELCQQVGETPQLFSAIFGLQAFYAHRAKLQTACELAERGLRLAQRVQDPGLLLEACHMLGYNLLYLGELTLAREYSERGNALYDPKHHSLAYIYGGDDPGVCCLCHRAHALWALGYADQALNSMHDALTLAGRLSHPLSTALAMVFATILHQFRQERKTARERAGSAMTLSTDHGFPYFLAWATILQGWALNEQGGEGIAQMRRGLAAYRETGADSFRPYHLALLAEAYSATGQVDEALAVVAEALTWADKNDERFYEAELYRLRGMLTLQSQTSLEQLPNPCLAGQESDIPEAQIPTLGRRTETEAEACFRRAIEVARKQEARSWELRATVSLARLWDQQGKRREAHQMLANIYGWFTEGFDTADLKNAKVLLDDLTA